MGRRTRKPTCLCLLAVVLAAVAGCLGGAPTLPDASGPGAPVVGLPQACKNHVYIFILEGLDPFNLPSECGLRDYLVSHGYIKTYSGTALYAPWYICEINRLHTEDHDAHFVLVGYGYGAEIARGVALKVKKEGAFVDLLVQVDTDPEETPQHYNNVGRALSLSSKGVEVQKAEEGSPASPDEAAAPAEHAGTWDGLARELAHVASGVRLKGQSPAEQTAHGPRPRARKLVPPDRAEEAEWAFLRPDSLSQGIASTTTPVMLVPGDALPGAAAPPVPGPGRPLEGAPPAVSKPAAPGVPAR